MLDSDSLPMYSSIKTCNTGSFPVTKSPFSVNCESKSRSLVIDLFASQRLRKSQLGPALDMAESWLISTIFSFQQPEILCSLPWRMHEWVRCKCAAWKSSRIVRNYAPLHWEQPSILVLRRSVACCTDSSTTIFGKWHAA